jgi:hypothetical protein
VTAGILFRVMAPTLASPALAVHVFFRSRDPHGEAAYESLLAMWSRCKDVLGMCEAVKPLALPVDLPKSPVDAMGSGPLAACQCPGSGIEQVMALREHDVFCLVVMLAPKPVPGVGWQQLDQRWAAVAANAAVLGEARLYLALLDGDHDKRQAKWPHRRGGHTDHAGGAGSSLIASNAQAVRAAMAASPDARSGWWERGSVTTHGFALWEASSPDDSRVERRIALVADRAQEAALDAWVWTRGDAALPPFGRYLLHAAKIRYELRVHADGQDLRQLRYQADERVNGLLDLLAQEDEAGSAPASNKDLVAASTQLAAVQAGSPGLVKAVTGLREMRRTVQIAAANMAAVLGSDAPDLQVADANHAGPLADDRDLAAWFVQRLDDDALYLEAAYDRTRDVVTVTATVVQHRLGQRSEAAHRRQEQFSLLQTAIIGALIIGLTAVPALGYQVPLPGPVKAPVVAALGAIALLLASIVLRLALQSGRGPLAWLSHAACGLTVAALVWLAVAWISGDAYHALATRGTTGMLAAIGFVVATLASIIISSRRSER